jgi:hypothetical protein
MAPAARLWIHGAMSGFLQLGGNAGAMTVRTPARALNSDFVPSTERPVLIVASVFIDNTDPADFGTVYLRVNGANVCAFQAGLAAGTPVQVGGPLVGLVPPGGTVRFATDIIGGAPGFGIAICAEVVL